MIIDTNEVEASCLFCPYAIDKKRWTTPPLIYKICMQASAHYFANFEGLSAVAKVSIVLLQVSQK
jgi:hypothetical protein